MPGQPLLTARGLRRTASNRVLWADLGLELYTGERLAVTGPSGSGKSLLLRTLALLDPLEAGSLHFHAQDVQTLPMTTYRTHVLYLPQRAPLYPGTVEENLRLPFTLQAYHGETFSSGHVTQFLNQLGRPETFLAQAAESLSGGEAQLVALVRALSLRPDVLLLDEATSALDLDTLGQAEMLLRNWVQDADRAFIWVGHDTTQRARFATRELALSSFHPVGAI